MTNKRTHYYTIVFLSSVLTLGITYPCLGKPAASIKSSVNRDERANSGKEKLIIPYAFPSDSLGTTVGVGGMMKGYHQDQLLIAGTVFGSNEDAKGFIGAFWDYRIPGTERLYFSMLGGISNFPNQRAYTELPRRPSGSRPAPPGSNDSDKDDYVEENGDDNWLEIKLEYVLPIGSMQHSSIAEYYLKNGILQSGATGGDAWNPLTSGISVAMFGFKGRYQSYKSDELTYDADTTPFRVGFLYNNTDFPTNPSRGSSQYIAFTQDFSKDSDASDWSFIEFEASKYIDLGASESSRQRVLALNFWTGTSPSWSEETDENGDRFVSKNPPFFEGSRLGGFYRMRAYPNNRFNDRSVIYTTAEYRHTLKWNPAEGVNWLNWLQLDWFQVVAFAEGGRVAGDYDLGELFSDWKYDGGVGLRAMTAGAVVRLDVAASEEGVSMWAMFGHPF
ncbi:BamA/TamA family outer membrane protein [Desulfosediminicola sp.]|uniref:BamA/TamA family outer membrane protein n=1 Tax=Desulfosediminicola sp. TaxID=2886825 RepID=UPI003AF30375